MKLDEQVQFAQVRDVLETKGVRSARRVSLPFMETASLVELLCKTKEGPASISLLWDEDKEVTILNQDGRPIHEFVKKIGLKIESVSDAEMYLRFFCDHVWGDVGPFRILDLGNGSIGPRDVGKDRFNHDSIKQLEVVEDFEKNSSEDIVGFFRATADVHYGDSMYRARFKISRSGKVEMEDDEFVQRLPPTAIYTSPFIRPIQGSDDGLNWQDRSPTGEDWRHLLVDVGMELLKRAAKRCSEATIRPKIDLRDLSVGVLDDKNGIAWPKPAQLFLGNFSYRSIKRQDYGRISAWAQRYYDLNIFLRILMKTILPVVILILAPILALVVILNVVYKILKKLLQKKSATKNRVQGSGPFEEFNRTIRDLRSPGSPVWKLRRRWLNRQYGAYRPTPAEYHPQPYEQLIRTLTAQGQYKDARRVISLKLTTERKVKASLLFKPFLWFFWLMFDYGLSATRASLTLLFFFAAGWMGVEYANNHGMLVADPVQTVDISTATKNEKSASVAPLALISDQTKNIEASHIPCGHLITPPLYALDVFLPVIDLRQEFRCHIRSTGPGGVPPVTAERSSPLVLVAAKIWFESILREPTVWLWLKAFYSVAGWVITSLAILTFSGIMQRQPKN